MQREVIDIRAFLNSNPLWLSQRLLAVRLRLRLPVLEGPLSPEDLRNESIRRSVSAYYHMVLHQEMPLEAVHFGIQHVVNYKLMHLIATQKKDEFESLFHYSYKLGNVVSDGEKSIQEMVDEKEGEMHKYIPVVLPSNVVDSVCEAESIPVLDVEEVVVTFPVKGKTIESSAAVLLVRGEEDLKITERICVSGVNVPGQKLNVAIPGIDAVVDMSLYQFTHMDVERSVEFNGVSSFDTMDDISPEFHPVRVISREWSIIVTYILSSNDYHQYVMNRKIIGNTVISNQLKRRYDKIELRIRKFFLELYNQLSCLKRTELIAHNMSALSSYRIPMSMPSGELINQSLYMVGRKGECSTWYYWFDETWGVQVNRTSWYEMINHVVGGNIFYRSIVDFIPRSGMLQNSIAVSPFLSEEFPDWGKYIFLSCASHFTYDQFIRFNMGEGYEKIMDLEERERMYYQLQLIKHDYNRERYDRQHKSLHGGPMNWAI